MFNKLFGMFRRPTQTLYVDDDGNPVDMSQGQIVPLEEEEEADTADDDEIDSLLAQDLAHSAGTHDKLIDLAIWAAAVFGTPIIWFILGEGNAELFSGFRGLSFDPLIILAYVGGFAYEFFTIVLILIMGRSAAKKEWARFFVTMGMSLFMATSSFYFQYLLLQYLWIHNILSFSDTVLAGLPISNHEGVFVIRAALPIVAEFAIVFIFAERHPDALETLKKKMHLQQQWHQYQQGKAGMMQSKAINDMVINVAHNLTAQMERQMEQFTQHGMVVQDTTPLIVERTVMKQVPERAQSKPVDFDEKKIARPQLPLNGVPPKKPEESLIRSIPPVLGEEIAKPAGVPKPKPMPTQQHALDVKGKVPLPAQAKQSYAGASTWQTPQKRDIDAMHKIAGLINKEDDIEEREM